MNYWILVVTFLGVNIDFFFILLFLLKKYTLSKVILGYLMGNIVLLTASYLVGKALAVFFPEWILGILGILPLYMAFHNDDDEKITAVHHSQILNVLLTYLAVCAGCNLSLFLPILAGETLTSFVITVLFLGLLTVVIVCLINLIGTIPIVAKIMTTHGEKLMKGCYILVGLYVFWDSGLITQILTVL
ncbi:cadmium resistance transporter [Liquorilactobacillus capillatus]|uniref:Integral membrane protein n=1 Tax=Liquorilactobacillus capillatus DSM 19910 TaxID=1423731 RepID=A0A0R1M2B5_9LACO|nr:cadmium resistance transporter [Liquorilactobacillus capillatus]KRL02175.1 integral membrane protein [Liquorilactobacillus capillatus DSM 19910]